MITPEDRDIFRRSSGFSAERDEKRPSHLLARENRRYLAADEFDVLAESRAHFGCRGDPRGVSLRQYTVSFCRASNLMRIKIIVANAIIVVILGILSFFVVRQSLNGAVNNQAAQRARAVQDASTASARLQLNALEIERWLTAKAQDAATQGVMTAATADARGNAASALCDKLATEAKAIATPAIVAVIDANGKFVGRNGSTLSRGEDAAGRYASFSVALSRGVAGSDIWSTKERSDQYVMSYAPIRDDKDKVVGALALGVTLTDQLSRVSEGLSGRGIVLGVAEADGVRVVATKAGDDVKARLEGDGLTLAKTVVASGPSTSELGEVVVAGARLESFGDGKRSVVLAAGPASLVEGLDSVPLSLLFIMLLGLIMVVAAGYMLGSSISNPIATLEEGLLAIINGQHDKRFNLEHPDLGGLAFRIDQLLNSLMGIEEDTSDADGKISHTSMAPAPANFRDLEDKQVDPSTDPAYAQKLANEPAEAYYARLYAEYISAKKGLGEAVDHITEPTFRQRIVSMEAEASQKQGKAVRYHVRATGREVVLVAIPL
jgi:hypothetical protein